MQMQMVAGTLPEDGTPFYSSTLDCFLEAAWSIFLLRTYNIAVLNYGQPKG